MNQGKTVLSQIMSFINSYKFDKCVKKYKGNYKVQSFTCWEQFVTMAFAQLTYRESLRDIETCLQAQSNKRYHIGLKSRVSKSTLADANERRPWRIYADLAQILIAEAVELYSDEDLGLELKNTVYALDSTTIDLCLSLFPWAKFRKTKSAVKMHTLLDLKGSIPTFIHITDASVHDVNILDIIVPGTDDIVVMDRGYIDFQRLYKFNSKSAFFVVRARKRLNFKRLYSKPVDKSKGLRCDQAIKLSGFYPKKYYPEKLRRIKLKEPDKKSYITLLTNNFDLPAFTVTELYRNRWKIELFFKWIKQHLRIKSFFGTSENAVKTQIWIAISVYVLIAIVRKKLKIECSMYKILQILSITLFEKVPIYQLLSEIEFSKNDTELNNQLILFDL